MLRLIFLYQSNTEKKLNEQFDVLGYNLIGQKIVVPLEI